MNYQERLAKAQGELGKVMRPGGVYHVDICHDSWCKTQRGKKNCNCDPDILLVVDGLRLEIGRDGTVAVTHRWVSH